MSNSDYTFDDDLYAPKKMPSCRYEGKRDSDSNDEPPSTVIPKMNPSDVLHRSMWVRLFQTIYEEIADASITNTYYQSLASRMAQERGFFLPSIGRVRKCYRKWLKSGRQHIPVESGRTGKGNRLPKISGQARELLNQAIDEIYLNRQQNSAAAAFRHLQGLVAKENQSRLPSCQVKCPSYEAVKRAISQLDPYEVLVARQGKQAADHRYRMVIPVVGGTYPLEYTEIDHTTGNILCVTKAGQPIGRPWVTVLCDSYSRAILGFALTFKDPSYASVLDCLAMAMHKKDGILASTKGCIFDWPCHGIPERINTDNGAEFHGDALRAAAQHLGFQVTNLPRRSPGYKGRIERFFRRLNDQLLHSMPGTTFSNPAMRGDYESEKLAVIELSVLRTHFINFIVNDLLQSEHDGLRGGIPIDYWRRGIQEYKPRLLPDGIDLFLELGIPDERTLTRHGIELFCMQYNSEELSVSRRIRESKTPKSTHKEKIEVYYNPHDISQILVDVPGCPNRIRVPCVDQIYSTGLSLNEHEAVEDYFRKRNQKLAKATEEQRALARLKLRESLAESINETRRAKRQVPTKKIAKIVGPDLDTSNPYKKSVQATDNPLPPPARPQSRLSKAIDKNRLKNKGWYVSHRGPNQGDDS